MGFLDPLHKVQREDVGTELSGYFQLSQTAEKVLCFEALPVQEEMKARLLLMHLIRSSDTMPGICLAGAGMLSAGHADKDQIIEDLSESQLARISLFAKLPAAKWPCHLTVASASAVLISL